MKDTRLRMVQTQPVLGDIQGNVDRMLDFIDSKADIICFPEMCMTGYHSKESHKHAIRNNDEQIARLMNAARENNTVVVFGYPERSEEGSYITQAIAVPDGSMHIYRKTHLGRFEKEHFVQGNEFLCVETEKANIGLQLCWESHFPEISTCLRSMDAEIILNPHASFKDTSDKRVELWKRYLPARAYDNRIFVAACDMLRDGKGGGMLVIAPDGTVIDEHRSEEECVVDNILRADSMKRTSADDRDMKGTDFFMARRTDLYRI